MEAGSSRRVPVEFLSREEQDDVERILRRERMREKKKIEREREEKGVRTGE